MSDTLECGCCAGVHTLTPGSEYNPPGQSLLRYRIGTHARFLQSQITRLAEQPELVDLTTRESNDPALALLDSWSAVLDVLSFYQERIANEGYLRTSTERRSVLELARAIGYELRSGVAASTFLAFTIESATGPQTNTHIAVGTKSQSIPAQDEKAQVFETLEAIDARPAWNALRVVHEETLLPFWGGKTLYLRGQNTRLQPGDVLLIIGDERVSNPGSENWDVRHAIRIQNVQPTEPSADPLAGYTVVTLDKPLGEVMPHVEPAKKTPRCYALRGKANLFGSNAPDWRVMPQTLRASYLGYDDPAQAKISEQGEWPGFTLADISDPPTNLATGTGLYAEYFEGLQLNKRKLSRIDATIDNPWNTLSLTPDLSATNFSARWTGWVQAPSSGDYKFFLRGDDGIRLWINDKLVINQWKLQAATEYASPSIAFQAGQKYDIRIEYYQGPGAAVCQLSWQGPGIAKQIVPSNRLYPRDIYTVHLDASYPKWTPGSWMVMSTPEYQEVYQIKATSEDARSQFTLSSKTTRLTLRGENLYAIFNERLRDITAYGESVELPWAFRPLSGLLTGHVLDLTQLEPDLAEGRWIAVSGSVLAPITQNSVVLNRLQKHDDLAAIELARDGKTALISFADGQSFTAALDVCSEVVRIRRADAINGHTQLQLESDLEYAYLPVTVRINANVAPASHGDSKQMQIQPEVLGSGDSSRIFQRFTLRQSPLTYVSASTPSGTQSTLEIHVDGVRWYEASNITALGPRDRSYLLRLSDDSVATVQFGDGWNGARLTSGQMNVEARYRVGIGSAGNVAAGKISLLLTRPLGLKDVTNPVPASGGVDPETGERARRNAPLTVRTLDRIVSLQDFEDFAAAYAGIGKAQAVWLWNGEERLVHLTVSGVGGANIDPASILYQNLTSAIDAVRPPHQPLVLAPGSILWFGLQAKVSILPDFESTKVLPRILQSLQIAFGFDARQYGQSLSGSELLAVMQAVEGVDWIDLDTIFIRRSIAGPITATVKGPDGRLRANRALWQNEQIMQAELLLLNANDVTLKDMTP